MMCVSIGIAVHLPVSAAHAAEPMVLVVVVIGFARHPVVVASGITWADKHKWCLGLKGAGRSVGGKKGSKELLK